MTVFDLGCGQGRDSIPIAKMGYHVIAIDHSIVGINKLLEKAKEQNVMIDAYCEDIYSVEISSDVDVILIDSMLHFYKNDREKEINFVNKILSSLKIGGLFVNFIIKGEKREKTLKEVIDSLVYKFEIVKG
jgi:2-polyprenyl-3-methyl-5-hydroxy-6-metoxy-1,4-benzoquinol methylase